MNADALDEVMGVQQRRVFRQFLEGLTYLTGMGDLVSQFFFNALLSRPFRYPCSYLIGVEINMNSCCQEGGASHPETKQQINRASDQAAQQ